jgi:Dot/Icm secretion system protein IcmQ
MADEKQDKNKESPEIDIGAKLVRILDEALNTGEWDTLFLRNVKKRLEGLRTEAGSLLKAEKNIGMHAALPSVQHNTDEYIKIYILLYQLDSNNLQSWASLIKTLREYNVNRPTYTNEQYIQEIVRSKRDAEKYGYVTVNIKKTNIYQFEKQMVDPFGHEVIAIKEKAIKLENIIEFVHANKRRYAFKDNKLFLIQ